MRRRVLGAIDWAGLFLPYALLAALAAGQPLHVYMVR